MKNLKKFAISLAVVAVTGLASVAPVNASIFGDDDDTDLGNLFILDRLFAGGLSGGAAAGQKTVVVEPGDTLSGIALTFLGNANLWPSIASLNNLANPDLIFPGQTIALPAAIQTDGGGIFGGDLGNLIILDELFGGGDGGLFGGEDRNLGDLFVLDALFGGGNGIFNGGTSGGLFGSGNNLGQLFILDRLFGSGSMFD